MVVIIACCTVQRKIKNTYYYIHVHLYTDPFLIFQMMKLQSVKSEIRYTPNMILVKLVGSHNISQVILRISDIKRTKMVQYTLVIVIS